MKRKQTYQSPQTKEIVLQISRVIMTSITNGAGESYGSEAGSYGENSGDGFGTEGGEW